MARSPWLRGTLDGGGGVRLLCVPHAGGGASAFNSWSLRLERECDVVRLQLPGREDRAHESPLSNIEAVLAGALPEVDAHLCDRPLVLYGHSLGALIAFEIALHLERRGHPPLATFVSSRRAPHCPLGRAPTCDLPLAEFVEYIVGLGGASARMMQSAKWRDYFVPAMRADLAVTDRYAPSRDRLSTPLFAYRGDDDPIVAPHEIEAWSAHTSSAFQCRPVAGGHFLPEVSVAVVMADVLEHVRAAKLGENADETRTA